MTNSARIRCSRTELRPGTALASASICRSVTVRCRTAARFRDSLSENIVFPDERAAIVVLTNQDAAGAAGDIANAIAPLLFASADAETPAKLEKAKKIFDGLQHGTIDRSLFTDNANAYFSDQALKDFASGLAPLGTPQSFVQVNQGLRGGMTLRVYIVNFGAKTLRAWTYEMPDGKLEQYQVAPQN